MTTGRLGVQARALIEETDVTTTPVDAVLRLTGRLRGAGAPVSTAETMDALRTLSTVDVLHRPTARRALRCALVKDPMHARAFEHAFDAVFARPRPTHRAADEPGTTDPTHAADQLAAAAGSGDAERLDQLAREAVDNWAGIDDYEGSVGHHTQRLLRTLSLDRILRGILATSSPAETEAERSMQVAGARDKVDELRALLTRLVAEQTTALGRATPDDDSGPFDPDRSILAATRDELDALRGAVRPLARRIAARLHRQRTGGTALDMRRTIRRSMSTGGVPLHPCARRKTPHRPELRVICDVSGSMAGYARFALALVHALQNEFPRTRSWVFVDGIVEVSDVLRGSGGRIDPQQLLGRRGLTERDGRSDYAAALGTFLARWPEALTPRSTVLILGDGRSHDRDPAVRELTRIARSARRTYWLNPEPRAEWDTDDSRMALYQPRCARVFEVATLRQLEHCVAEIGR